MQMSPEQKLIKIEEVRYAMLKSAQAHAGAIVPATKVDLSYFYNNCTGCIAAVKQLHTFKDATITETLWKEVNVFTENVELLREEVVKLDKSYQLDLPLVRCLGQLMNKGDTVLREIRKQCNQDLLATFGDDWMNETNERYAKDLQIIIKDLAPCVNYSLAQRGERAKAAAAAAKKPAPPSKPAAPAGNAPVASGKPSGGTDAGTAKSTALNTGINFPPPSIAGAADKEKHITFVAPTPDNEKPEQVGVAVIPHFKAPNYINLPQFTGVPESSRPIFQQEMPPLHATPAAELIYMADKYPPP